MPVSSAISSRDFDTYQQLTSCVQANKQIFFQTDSLNRSEEAEQCNKHKLTLDKVFDY